MKNKLVYAVVVGICGVVIYALFSGDERHVNTSSPAGASSSVATSSIDSIANLQKGEVTTVTSVQVAGIEKHGFTIIDGAEPVSGIFVVGSTKNVSAEMCIEKLEGQVAISGGKKVLKLISLTKCPDEE